MSAPDDALWGVLHDIDDPCMCLAGKGLSIVDMGIVNHAHVHDGVAHVSLTFTDPNCLFEYRITRAITDRAGALDGIAEVAIEITCLPIWTNDRLSPKAARHFEEERRALVAQMRLSPVGETA